MFQKVFEYAGPHKKGLYAATAIVLVSVLLGVLPFVLDISGNCTAGHGGGRHRFLYHPACRTGLGMSGATSSFLWMGPESLS